MTTHFIAYAPDGTAFRLLSDRTWELEPQSSENQVLSFRNKEWGSSVEAVKRQETSTLIGEEKEVLAYSSNVAGNPVEVIYWFTQGHLSGGMYDFKQEHSNDQDFYFDFLTLKRLYESKFGPPADTKEYWSDDRYKDDFDQWGFAVSLGHYSCFHKWNDGTTELVLQLTGDNYKIGIQALYKSIQLKGLVDAEMKKQLIADL